MEEHLRGIYIRSYILITFMLVITYVKMITTCVHELQFFLLLMNFDSLIGERTEP